MSAAVSVSSAALSALSARFQFSAVFFLYVLVRFAMLIRRSASPSSPTQRSEPRTDTLLARTDECGAEM